MVLHSIVQRSIRMSWCSPKTQKYQVAPWLFQPGETSKENERNLSIKRCTPRLRRQFVLHLFSKSGLLLHAFFYKYSPELEIWICSGCGSSPWEIPARKKRTKVVKGTNANILNTNTTRHRRNVYTSMTLLSYDACSQILVTGVLFITCRGNRGQSRKTENKLTNDRWRRILKPNPNPKPNHKA